MASNRGGARLLPPAIARLALRGVLGAALLIGVAQPVAFAHDAGPHANGGHSRIEMALRNGDPAKAVALGEAAVISAPQDATLRAELGHAYLRAGRFDSAAAALSDAVMLGATSDQVALGLALAQIACGQNRAALATLDRGSAMAAADLGLALALAGDPARGIAVLTDAVRDGSGTVNLRQNLAYAYALDGRWADATLTAGFDLPPDQVNARLQQWAQSMQSGAERMRIAQLLNVPLIADQGMPAALALNTAPAAPASPALAPAAEELPPMPIVSAPTPVAAAAPLAPVMTAPLPQDTAVDAPVPVHRPTARAHVARRNVAHFVQLASYHNRRGAELGKAILVKRHSLLRGHRLLITQANIQGRSYWRVVMTAFDNSSAMNFCSSLKRHGAACFAYSAKPRRQGQALAIADVLTHQANR